MKMIIFDIDGTLLLAGGVGVDAFNQAFNELFHVPEVWDHYDPHGKTDQEIIQDLSRRALGRQTTPEEMRRLSERYTELFASGIDRAERFRLMPGAFQLLQTLHGRQDLLGLATGNFELTAQQKLRRAGLSHFFRFGGFGSDAYERLALTRLALERGLACAPQGVRAGEVVLIGDARQDIECGKALGLRTAAVATGSLGVDELKVLNPDLVLETLEDLSTILEFIDNPSLKQPSNR